MDRLLAGKQSLEQALASHRVVPVVGPDFALVDRVEGAGDLVEVPFYDLVVDRLLQTYDVRLAGFNSASRDAGGAWLLHRAVAQILASRPEVGMETLRRSVAATVRSTAAGVRGAKVLDRFAELRAFDLFICLTPDDFFVEALQRARGQSNVEIVTYTPTADSSQTVDVSPRRKGLARVFFPLGRCAAATRIAVHEEDTLEYLFKFQEEGLRRAPTLLSELRASDLLLLGCNLPDWLGRGFLRMARERRLSSEEREMEFFAADTQDPLLTSFLSRFDPNSNVFPWSPQEFVAELETMVGSGLPSQPKTDVQQVVTATSVRQTRGPTVFISYASQDRDAACRLADRFLALGFADVWLDRRKLLAGDDWSERIDDAIEGCDFFVPILSQQADQRREGVFWEEWRKAFARALRVHDAFILPIAIDQAAPEETTYQRLSVGWSADLWKLHVVHAPDGMLGEPAAAQLRARCTRFEGGRSG